MTITIPADKMLQAVLAIDMVPPRAGIVPSEFIQIEKVKDKLYFSLAAEVYGRTFAKGSDSGNGNFVFHVDRSSFVPFVEVVKGITGTPAFVISYAENKKAKKLTVKCGRRKVVFNAVTFVSGYPIYTASDGVAISLNKKQKELLMLSSKYATSDPTLAALNCVYMRERSAILSTNKISLFKGKNKELPISVPLPIMLLGMLDHDSVKSIEIAKKAIKLNLENGYICQAINATAKKEFPKENVLNQFKRGIAYPIKFKVKAKPFLQAASRLQAYTKSVVARELLLGMACDKTSDKIVMYCDTPSGRFSEIVRVAKANKEELLIPEILLNSLASLAEANFSLGTLEVRYNDKQNSPYYIKTQAGIEVMIARRVKRK